MNYRPEVASAVRIVRDGRPGGIMEVSHEGIDTPGVECCLLLRDDLPYITVMYENGEEQVAQITKYCVAKDGTHRPQHICLLSHRK